MKKCENVMLLFSHTGVLVNNGHGRPEIAFLPAKEKQEVADILSCVCSHQPLPESTSNSWNLHSLVAKSALNYCCQEPAHHCQAAKSWCHRHLVCSVPAHLDLVSTELPLDPSLNSSLQFFQPYLHQRLLCYFDWDPLIPWTVMMKILTLNYLWKHHSSTLL